MRTKEKFYDNLSKFQVSHDKKVERFEFRDIKTLDALLGGGASLLSNHKTALSKYITSEVNFKKADTVLDLQRDIENTILKKLEKTKNDAKKEEIRLQNALSKESKTGEKLLGKFAAARKKMDDDEEKVIIIQNKIKGIADKIADNLQIFKDGAKSLGIDVSSELTKYKSMIKKLVEKENIL